MAGIPVVKTGEASGDVYAVGFDAMEVVQALHTGPYEEFTISYDKLDQYIITNALELTGEAFEFYLSDPGSEPDPSKWVTRIAFPLNK